MSPPQIPTFFTVTSLNQTVRNLLEQQIGQVSISGEISNFIQPSSGHWYFTLKDDFAQVRCAMFRNNNRYSNFRPQHGQQLLVYATITLYEPRGDYQIIVDNIQPIGEGVLQKKFEQLKMKLSSEGLFDQKFKKSIPSIVNCVGVITSKTGAALYDILHVLKRRDLSLSIIIYPTAVQGEKASEQIARAIELANMRQECDVLIVGRGGGSLEDLWNFNEECVARAIFNSTIPIVSAVGHETDSTIADYVADLRAPTPSAAAEIVSCNRLEQLRQLHINQQRFEMAMDYYLASCSSRITRLNHRLQQKHPQLYLAHKQLDLERRYQRMKIAFSHKLKLNFQKQQLILSRFNKQNPCSRIWCVQKNIQILKQRLLENMRIYLSIIRERISNTVTHLEAINPLLTLVRGYSITVTVDGKVIKKTKNIKVNDIIITRFIDGWIVSKVESVKQNCINDIKKNDLLYK